MLGGIYSPWQGTNTLSIVTTDTSPKLATVHNEGLRQPLILDGDAALAWLIPDLTEDEMEGLMVNNYPDEKLTTYRVMNGVYDNTKNTNVPAVIEPYDGLPSLIQTSLFD